MPGPFASDVHVSVPLTNVAIAYWQDERNFVADRVFPNIPVAKQADQFWKYNREDWNREQMKERAPGTESAGGGYELERDTYFASVKAFHKDVDDQTRANADAAINVDGDATRYVTRKALLHREVSWATKFFKAGVWESGATGVDASPGSGEFLQWSDPNSTPIEDVRAAKRSILEITGFLPNKLVLGRAVYDALLDHPDIIDRVKYGQTPGSPAMANETILAQLFEVEEVVVSNAIQNTAVQGQTEANSFIMGYHALLVYAPRAASMFEPSAGYTFSWTGYLGAAPGGYRIKRFRIERLEVDRVEIAMAFDQKVVGADLGYFFENAANNPQSGS